jgi:hypothetical protein
VPEQAIAIVSQGIAPLPRECRLIREIFTNSDQETARLNCAKKGIKKDVIGAVGNSTTLVATVSSQEVRK